MRYNVFLILLLGAVIVLPARSQDLEIGIFGGGSYYLGDINPGLHFMQTKPAYGIVARYNQNTRLSGRIGVFFGEVAGSDQTAQFVTDRDLNFTSPLTDITVQFEFNFLPYFTGSSRNFITPYIFGGMAGFFYQPKSNGVKLRDAGTEGQLVGFDGRKQYSGFSVALPFGIGLKYSLGENVGMGFEWGMRKTFTDYIDDISQTYYLDGPDINPLNSAQFLSDPTRSKYPGMQRGNPKTKDWYAFFGVSITYRFDVFGRQKCLEYNNQGSY